MCAVAAFVFVGPHLFNAYSFYIFVYFGRNGSHRDTVCTLARRGRSKQKLCPFNTHAHGQELCVKIDSLRFVPVNLSPDRRAGRRALSAGATHANLHMGESKFLANQERRPSSGLLTDERTD
jgi:hypothetical protein